MPRQERTKSGTGIYHVMLRGINKQDMFEDDEDYLQMTSIKTKMITEPSLGRSDTTIIITHITKYIQTISEFIRNILEDYYICCIFAKEIVLI